ncbi:MAG TPA: aromatic ring-hydroxylating dioxygenase subunit alpha [Actinocrinis sp.]|nr:aromatic ring-hydroxylating dioxygenase subunit alpha [Actinocrinis sp.]
MTVSPDITVPRGCTFDPDDWAILARHWYPIALSREVGEDPVSACLLDEPLVVYRAGGQVVIANDICPHRGVPLSLGSGDRGGVTCAYHGLHFGAAGVCDRVPAHPEAKIPARLHLRTYPAVERYGLIWTCLLPGTETLDAFDGSGQTETVPRVEIPAMPHWDDPDFQQITCPSFDVAAFAGRQLEGFLDVAHFGFVHRATFGDPQDTAVPEYTPVASKYGFSVDYWSTVGNYPHGGKTGEPDFLWLRRFDAHLPFTATLVVHFPGEGRLCIMNAASPMSARKTRVFVPIGRNFDTDQPVQDVYDFNLRIFEEDRAIVEVQKPENLPLDPRIEVNIPADRSSVAYRRGLRDLGLSHFFTA